MNKTNEIEPRIFQDRSVANEFLGLFRDVICRDITWPEIIERLKGEADGDGFPNYLPDTVWEAWDDLSLESKVVAMAIAQHLQCYGMSAEDVDF